MRHVDFEDLNGPYYVELGVENWRLFGCMLPHHRGFRLRVYFCTKMPSTLVGKCLPFDACAWPCGVRRGESHPLARVTRGWKRQGVAGIFVFAPTILDVEGVTAWPRPRRFW